MSKKVTSIHQPVDGPPDLGEAPVVSDFVAGSNFQETQSVFPADMLPGSEDGMVEETVPLIHSTDAVNLLRLPHGCDETRFEYRWVNNDPGRIEYLSRQSGYQVWGCPEDKKQLSVPAGINRGGDPRRMVLMYRPVILRHRQNDIWRAEMDELKRGLEPATSNNEASYVSGRICLSGK